MGRFQVLADVIAVASGRLVLIVRVEADGSVVVRDLAAVSLRSTSASELCAPPYPSEPAGLPHAIARATDAQWERARRREAVVA